MANPLMPLKWSLYLNSLEIEQDITKIDFYLFRRKSPYFHRTRKAAKKILANFIVLC